MGTGRVPLANLPRLAVGAYVERLIWTALSENKSASKAYREQSRRACPELVEGDG